jgi:hypothetical protein
MEQGWPAPAMNRNPAAEHAPPAETNRQSAPNIDIDSIVDKVERRFVRRLAIESERRGRSQWR